MTKLQSALAVLLLSTLANFTFSRIERTPELCCADLHASDISGRIAFPNTITYNESINSYFAVNARLHPTCIVQPLSTHDVSVAMQILGSSRRCQFAIRSGGHSTSVGGLNIQPGITIDLSLMNRTTYSPSTGTASIQPGARWSSVYNTLLEHAVMVPGGRTASVGVGGFLIGGGNSFYAAQVGIACDNVEEYEVVLASGEIVTANRHINTDLFKALKGGSSNFGIVTRFEVAAFPSQNLWGGNVIHDYNPSTLQQYIPAAISFTKNIPKDPYASWVGFVAYNFSTDRTGIISSLAYTRPVERPYAFRDFYMIPNITDTLRLSKIVDLTTENLFPSGYRNVVQTGTYLNREEVLQKAVDILTHQVQEARSLARSRDFNLYLIVQPWDPLFWKDSETKGGNVLGLERFDQAMFNILWDYSWDNESDDNLFYSLAESARVELDEYAKSRDAYNEYIYMNYAGSNQNPIHGYGPKNLAFVRQVGRKYDPKGVFQKQVPGGFKL
ncbi:FAD-binding oxidoreductase [Aspergillus affinis]|uniref:FAD-binding oxidoreductase n=1 Tax=Aspergillus affinis TaxID=1070780 RepID=UPI0022FDC94A|nr:uncharacterized protein KD926_009140 [Aspergillus affinis]KAI9039670.1 hypothetical protein KD926_009140 [Aspergillus affinis]